MQQNEEMDQQLFFNHKNEIMPFAQYFQRLQECQQSKSQSQVQFQFWVAIFQMRAGRAYVLTELQTFSVHKTIVLYEVFEGEKAVRVQQFEYARQFFMAKWSKMTLSMQQLYAKKYSLVISKDPFGNPQVSAQSSTESTPPSGN